MKTSLEKPSNGLDQPTGDLSSRWQTVIACALLVAAVWAVFGQTIYHEFLNYDDNLYVYENPTVIAGISLKGLWWALTYGEIGHWHPVTWISHMLDCEFYGLHPGGHHLTNVLIHTATTILLFLWLRKTTSADWRSFFAAAFFALHPLRVESVAWIAERKDVLSGLFLMLTLWAYSRYAQRITNYEKRITKGEAREKANFESPITDNSTQAAGITHRFLTSRYYWLALFFFALGLMSKSMLVTLPFLLLLLDIWPLGRIANCELRIASWRKLLPEKIPFFLLAVGSSIATSLVPEAISPDNQVAFPLRLQNAIITPVDYLGHMLWPRHLSIPYLYPTDGFHWWEPILALAVLAGITGAVIGWRQKRPYLMVGWFWYLGMLMPVIGLVQISYYARADRYTYLPLIGLIILTVWGVNECFRQVRFRRLLSGVVGTAVILSLIMLAQAQTMHWQNSLALWKHSLENAPDNYTALNNLGVILTGQGKSAEAMVDYQRALELKPDYSDAHNNLGFVLAEQGRLVEAMQHYERAIQLKPDFALAHLNLGMALARQGNLPDAITHFDVARRLKPDSFEANYYSGVALTKLGQAAEASQRYQQALKIQPEHVQAHIGLGEALAAQGSYSEAVSHYEKALQLKPDDADIHFDLGVAQAASGNLPEAQQHYERTVQLKPDHGEARLNLGVTLARQGKLTEAVGQFQKAVELEPNYPDAHNNLGNALAHLGKTPEAITQFEQALQLKPDYAEARFNLGNALAAQGKLEAAIQQYQQAWSLATNQDNTMLADAIRSRLEACQKSSTEKPSKPE